MRIVQISDTHLSPNKPHFVDNWASLAAWIIDQHPDLVIHTGDVTFDGAGVEADLSFSAQVMNELRIRWRAVPGNHDVGGPRHATQPVNAERLGAWQRHFGPDRWVQDVEGAQRWRLVGLDAMLVGSGEPEENEQALWLEQVMADAGERRIAWFLHRPLSLEDPGEGDTGYWSMKPQPRGALMALVRRHQVVLVACGHLHKARDFVFEGTRYIWSPASSFLVGGAVQPEMPGEKRLGAMVYELDNAISTARIAEVPGLTQHWFPANASG